MRRDLRHLFGGQLGQRHPEVVRDCPLGRQGVGKMKFLKRIRIGKRHGHDLLIAANQRSNFGMAAQGGSR